MVNGKPRLRQNLEGQPATDCSSFVNGDAHKNL